MESSTNSKLINQNASGRSDAYLIIDRIVFPLPKTKFTIGRAIQNDLVLNDAQTAQFHAEIINRHGQFQISNTAQESWMLVNGEQIDSCTLHSGDIIQIGRNPIIFIFRGESISEKARKISIKIKKFTKRINTCILH